MTTGFTNPASTSNKSAGDAANFKLTNGERVRIFDAIKDQWPHAVDPEQINYIIEGIERIINEGWQTCTCPLDSDV